MKKSLFETLLGTAVLALVAFIAFFVYKNHYTAGSGQDPYSVTAEFDTVIGLGPGTLVAIAGVEVGQVDHVYLDPVSFVGKADVKFFNKELLIPGDSIFSVKSKNLIGGSYLAVIPGASSTPLQDGDTISMDYTQSGLDLGSIVAQFAFGTSEDALSDADLEAVDAASEAGFFSSDLSEEEEALLNDLDNF